MHHSRVKHVAYRTYHHSDLLHHQTFDPPLSLHVLLGRNFVEHEPGRRPSNISCHNGRHGCTTSAASRLESGARKIAAEGTAALQLVNAEKWVSTVNAEMLQQGTKTHF